VQVMQRAACSVQLTSCNLQDATCNKQCARCNVHDATGKVQDGKCCYRRRHAVQVNAEAAEALLACAGLILPGNLKRSAAAYNGQRAPDDAAPCGRQSVPSLRNKALRKLPPLRDTARHHTAAHSRTTKRAACMCAGASRNYAPRRTQQRELPPTRRSRALPNEAVQHTTHETLRHATCCSMQHGAALLQPPRGAAERADDRAREEAPAHRDWCATSVLHLSRAPIQTRSHIAVLPPIAIGARQAPAPMHAHAPARACARKLGRSHAHAHRRPHQSTSRLAQTARSPTS
jgi:hypothetical protein